MPDNEEYLDVKGLLCPLPVLKARKRLSGLPAEAILKVDATDPASMIDFPHYCNESGNILVRHSQQDGVYTFWVRKT